MMSQRSKREMNEAICNRYLKANKAGKVQILDEFIATTGYHRKYAIRALKHGPKPKGLKKPERRKKYQGEVVNALEQVWEIYGRICSKRLHPFLSEGIAILERCHELIMPPETKQLLLSMSQPQWSAVCKTPDLPIPNIVSRPPNRDTYSIKLFPFAPLLPGKMNSRVFGN